MKLVIIDYGAGNIQSVKFAFERLGVTASLTNNFEEIRKADKVIFPGVGEASNAMKELKKFELEKLIPELTQPVLGICLGMQLMCDFTEENNTDCLGIFPLKVSQFQHDLKIPHMGWNQVDNLGSDLYNDISDEEYVYFVHSYYVPISEYTVATSNYGTPFSASLKKDNFYACQFHPEKSSLTGHQILKNFLEI